MLFQSASVCTGAYKSIKKNDSWQPWKLRSTRIDVHPGNVGLPLDCMQTLEFSQNLRDRVIFQETFVTIIAQEGFSGNDRDIVHTALEEGMSWVRKGVIQRERMVSWLIASLEAIYFYLLLAPEYSHGMLDKASKPYITVWPLFSLFSGSPLWVWDAK